MKLRPGRESDHNFVKSTMLKGLYYSNPFYHEIDQDIFFREYGNVVKHLLDKAELRVICLQEDEDVILGYAIVEPRSCHYIFVKDRWRRQQVATQLLAGLDVLQVSHLTV